MATQKGHADYYDRSSWNAACYECGRKFKGSELVRHWQGYWVCKQHWEPRQTQDFVRGIQENIAPPFVQSQTELYPLLVENISTSAAEYQAQINNGQGNVVINIFEGVTIGNLILTPGVTGTGTVTVNNNGVVTVTNNLPSGIAVVYQGQGTTTVGSSYSFDSVLLDDNEFGYIDGTGGGMSPFTFQDAPITRLTNTANFVIIEDEPVFSHWAVELRFSGSYPQSFFSQLTVNGYHFSTAAADLYSAGGETQWIWITGGVSTFGAGGFSVEFA